MFEKFQQHLKARTAYDYQPTSTEDDVFLEFLKQCRHNEDFQRDFLKFEMNARGTNTPMRYRLLSELAWPTDKDCPTRWRDFNAFLTVVKFMLEIYPANLLNEEQLVLGISLLGNFTLLSLSINYLVKLYKKNRDNLSQFLFKEVAYYQDLQKKWIYEVVRPLLAKGCNVDLGACNGLSILSACIQEYLPPNCDQPFASLIDDIIMKTKAVDKSSPQTGTTPLVIAALRGLPDDVIEKLIHKGSNVNVCSRKDWFHTVEQPLICHLISLKQNERRCELISLLLRNGANPNLIPIAGERLSNSLKSQETWLSPYQLAVALDDEEVIAIINKHASLQKIQLVPELSSIEQERDTNITLKNGKLKFQGSALFLQCKSRLFKTEIHFLDVLKQKYGVRCFVHKASDRNNISRAILWLMDNASNNCAGRFWKIAQGFLMQEFATNPNFNICVSSAPSTATNNRVCAGLYDQDKELHIECDLPEEILIDTLAHEIGHLVDVRSFAVRSISNFLKPAIIQLKDAINKDVSAISLAPLPLQIQFKDHMFWLNARLLDLKNNYKGERVHEYFTYIFFELPINFARCNSNASEQDLLTFLGKYFPNSLQWFLQHENQFKEFLNGAESQPMAKV